MNIGKFKMAMKELNEASKLFGWSDEFHCHVEMQLIGCIDENENMKERDLVDMCAALARISNDTI